MNKKNTLLIFVLFFQIAFVSFGNNFHPLKSSKDSEKLNTTTIINGIDDLITEAEWLTYFPYRWGYDINTSERTSDFYTYEKFKEAIQNISKYELLIERRCGTNQIRVTHTNTETGVRKVVSTSTDYNAAWNLNKPLVKEKVFYKNFLSEGTITIRKRELAAFLANISHETTGGPAVGNTYEWGLFFREEGENTAEPPNNYVSANTEYPAVPGKSYHGRGPIQLSYNYNYGPASEHIFGDKNILLSNPELVSTDAAISFMTAIWFWMTPQSPKPSAHDVIAGNWTPTVDDIEGGRIAGLGMTINIINGGVECGLGRPEDEPQVIDRINYYKRYASILNISTDIDGTNECNTCGCASITNYSTAGSAESCAAEDLISIAIKEPVSGSLIKAPLLEERKVTSEYPTNKGTVTEFELTIDDAIYYSTSLNWIPRFFKSYLLKASVNINNTPYEDTALVTIYEDESAIDCSNIPVWTSKDYVGASIVKQNGKIYKAKFYTSQEPPHFDWEEFGTCLTNNAPTLSITSEDKQSYYEIKATAADTDSGLFFIDFYVDGELKESYNPRVLQSDVIKNKEKMFSFISGSLGKDVLKNTIKIIAYDKYGASDSEEFVITTNPSCGVPKWFSDLEYLTPNPLQSVKYFVEYNGKVYENNAYVGAGESPPSNNSKWDLVANSCDELAKLPLADNCSEASPWDVNIPNYNENDLVSYKGGLYMAKSWVSGKDIPERYGQYNYVGVCLSKPIITTSFNKEVTYIKPTIEPIEIIASINSFGVPLSEVQYQVKSVLNTTFTVFNMTSTNGEDYYYSWTPASYGIYKTKITAKNSANQEVEVLGEINLSKSKIPSIEILSPENEKQFYQETFTKIPINFKITPEQGTIKSVIITNKSTGIETILPIEQSGIYQWEWTPATYGTHAIVVKAINDFDDFNVLELQYTIINPKVETVSFNDLYQIVAIETIEKSFIFDKDITGVKMRNPGAATVTFNNKTLTVKADKVGRSGLEIITSDGESHFIGLRIDHIDGRVVGLPDYVAIGSVSEDVPLDIQFWEDIDDTNLKKNKRMDIRYIYVNGGADTGWPVDNPKRVENYVKNSLRYGLIPCFIYYQIPDKNESYFINDISIRDPEYMTKYFNNITLFIDEVKKYIDKELFVVVLEPDFLGYLQQVGEGPDRQTAVKDNLIAKDAGTLKELVQRINKEFDTRRKKDDLTMLYGWQLNLWAKAGVASTRGIIRETDNVSGVGSGDFPTQLQKIRQTAKDITQYGIDVGILSNNADFVSIDKYGLDAIAGPTPGFTTSDPLTQPEAFTWFWNNDHWINYIEFVKAMHELSQKHIVLWQVPVGHINQSQTISAYSGVRFKDLPNTSKKYEDSATTFFFGDEFIAESDERYDYFTQNKHNDPKLTFDSTTKKIKFGSHMEEVLNAGVRIVLGGAGVGASTDGVGSPPSDDYFWIQKVQDYYQNQIVALEDADKDGVNDFDDVCSNTPSGESADYEGCSESQKDDDKDGITNDKDECPYTLVGVIVEESGCEASLSIDTIEEEIAKIYPNPTTSNFVVNISVNSLKIYSITGKLILESKENTNKKTYNISHLKKGLYLVEIISTNDIRTFTKLIKF